MKHLLLFLLLLNVLFVVPALAGGGDDVPVWLSQAAALKPPVYDKDVPAVVLRSEQQVNYGSDGKLVVTENYALRILSKEGRALAIAHAFYLVSSGKVREMTGWLIRGDGTSKKYEKNAILDMISDPDDVYNEGRVKTIDASDDADAGSVFGYQVVSEDKPLFYQDTWMFQERLPVLMSRYTLTLPAGWKASSITFNHTAVQPQISGSSYA